MYSETPTVSVILALKVSSTYCAETSEEVNVTIEALPTFAIGNDTSLCEGALLLRAEDYAKEITWSSQSGSGIISRPSQNSSTDSVYYIPSVQDYSQGAEVEIKGTVASGNSCAAVEGTQKLTLLPKIIVDAGPDLYQTGGGAITLDQANALNASSYLWSTSGLGTFSSENQLSTTYTPTTGDVEDGMIKLTLTVPAAGECPDIKDDFLITLSSCDITIQESIIDNTVQFTALNSNSKVLSSYTWDFGDSKTRKGQNVKHTYTGASTYSVSVNSKTVDNTCNANATKTITIANTTNPTYEISGKIDIGGSNLSIGKVVLYYLSPNNTYEVKAEINLAPSANGEYSFNGLEQDIYFIATYPVIPAVSTGDIPVPTFFGNETSFADADKIVLSENNEDVDISLSTFTPPTNADWKNGTDKVRGNVIFDENFLKTGGGSRDIVDNPLPVQNAAVLLYNEDGALLSFTTTDEFGDFNFENLGPGVYELSISYLGTSISITQTIVIDGDDQTIDQFSFKLGQDDTEATSILTNTDKAEKLYPNPAKSSVNIILDDQTRLKEYTITDISGNLIKSDKIKSDLNSVNISLEDLNAGVYFIKIDDRIFKVVKI